MFAGSKKRAKEEGRTPDFTLETIKLLAAVTPICPVFGYPLQYGCDKSADHSATVDAYIHAEGHQQSNLRIISRRANTIKNSATTNEMKLLLDAVRSWIPPNPSIITLAKRIHTVLSTDQTMKICSVCRVEKALIEYTKDASNKTLGLSSRCKRCSALKAMLSNAHTRVRNTTIPFSLTLDYLHTLAKDIMVCPILKLPLQYAGGKLCDRSASLDRFIPDLGYVPGNVWIICDKANRMKSDADPNDIERVYLYMLSSVI